MVALYQLLLASCSSCSLCSTSQAAFASEGGESEDHQDCLDRKAELGERICAALSAAYPNDLDINQICDALGFAPGALGDERKRLGKSMALEMINHLWNEKDDRPSDKLALVRVATRREPPSTGE